MNVARGVVAPDLAEVFGALRPGDTLLRCGVEDVAEGDPVTVRMPAPQKPGAGVAAGAIT